MKKETVYISELLKNRHPAFYKNLFEILNNNGYAINKLKNTKDIWCRDYMPIAGDNIKLVRFTYKPSYLTKYKKYQNKITEVDNILSPTDWTYKKSNIKLDGGAIEILDDQGIISDRVFIENKDRDELELLEEISKVLGLSKLTVIPQHPDDFTGHVDGLARFIDKDTILINDLTNEYRKNWALRFKISLYNAGYKTETLPYRTENNKGADARGIYMNFLKLENLIIMPTFTFEKEDKQAQETLMKLYPGRKVETIYGTDLAKDGGIVNCVTWSI